jgi:flagellar motor switch protein FliN
MAELHPALEQLLSPVRAASLQAATEDAWDGIARMLGAILGAEPAFAATSARLVMPDEVTGEFEDAHLVLPLELAAATGVASGAWFVLPASEAASFFDQASPAATAANLAGQIVQAVNATALRDAADGTSLVAGDVAADTMPAILAELEEACLLFEGRLAAGRELPFSAFLPATFLEHFAAAAGVVDDDTRGDQGATVDLSRPGAFFELPDDLPAPAAPVPATPPQREPTPIMAAPTAQRAQFAPLPEPASAHVPANIGLLSDLEMSISVELGRTEMSVADVLALGVGSVIELDRLAGEPVDILVNDRIIARGEVVVVDENFGVRIVEVLPRSREIGKAS